MKNGLLAMAYHSPTSSDDLGDADSEDSDDWSQMTSHTNPYDDNLGPGPPPPEFLLPPPPMPDFMLQELEGDCAKRSLPEHFANCDMSFASIKSTSSGGGLPGLFGGSDGPDSGTSHLHMLLLTLGAVALVFLAVCVAIFLVWRRCRSRNRLSYLRKTCSTYETTVENTSEHPLIYDDSNFVNGIRTQPRIPVAHVNSYQLENRNDRLLTQMSAYPFDSSSTATRSICRPDRLHFQQQQQQQHHHQQQLLAQQDLINDNERIYEELYLAEDHVYSDAHQGAIMPHLSDHYYQPPMASIPPTSISRSSTLNSIKRMLGFRSNNEADVLNPHRVTSPFMHYVPAPAQFMSPGAVSSDSLMLMSPDYSAVYHPLIVPPQEGTLTLDHNHINNNANLDVLQQQQRHSSKMASNMMAESSFSSSSCSSGSTRPPSHNNSTTSTLPVACLSASSCSCSSSSCQYQRNRRQTKTDENEEQISRGVYSFLDQPVNHCAAGNLNNTGRSNFGHPDQLGYAMHLGVQGSSSPAGWASRPRFIEKTEDENNGFFASLWRKRKSKTNGRKDNSGGRNKMTSSASATIFRLDPSHPSYPRFSATGGVVPASQVVIVGTPNASLCHNNSLIRQNFASNDGNGNLPLNASLPLSLGVHLPPSLSSYNQNQRFSFATAARGQSSNNNHNNDFNRSTTTSRQTDLISGRSFSTAAQYGTPTLSRTPSHGRPPLAAHPGHFHGTLSNRRRRPKRRGDEKGQKGQGENGDDSEDENARLLLLPSDDVWQHSSSSSGVSATLGRQSRVSGGNQGVMPNPDDILPKRAWTDFSGTDEWPNFVTSADKDNHRERSKRDKAQNQVRDVSDDNDDSHQGAYVNVEPARSPPKPKERKLLKKTSSGIGSDHGSKSVEGVETEDLLNHQKSPSKVVNVKDYFYESLVDDGDDELELVCDEPVLKLELNNCSEDYDQSCDVVTSMDKIETSHSFDEKVSPSQLSSCSSSNESVEEKEGMKRDQESSPRKTFRSTKFISVTNPQSLKSPTSQISAAPVDR